MLKLQIPCLLFISTLAFSGCASLYGNLPAVPGDPRCPLRWKPAFRDALYKAEVDVAGRQLSGLLLIKQMPDSSLRLVFSNEVGFKFFDFAFRRDSGFQVLYLIKSMNKKAVIRTLRKDFELVLMWQLEGQPGHILADSMHRYYAFPQAQGTNYYITDSNCRNLIRAERASRTKPVMLAEMLQYDQGIPDSIGIRHLNFHFTISLKYLPR